MGDSFSVKIFEKSKILENSKVEHIRQEKNLLTRLGSSPWVLRLFDEFEDDRHIYRIMEMAHGGDLLTMIKHAHHQSECEYTCTEDAARFYTAEILFALEFLHGEGIIHRNLNPESILIMNTGHIKITDLGNAFDVQNAESIFDHVGTPGYVAPEILKDRLATPSADMWALGCIIFHLLVGRAPFTAPDEWSIYNVIENHCNGTHPLKIPETVSEAGVADLVTDLLLEDPIQRANLAGVKQHTFLKGIADDAESIRITPPPWVPGLNTGLESDHLLDFRYSQTRSELLCSLQLKKEDTLEENDEIIYDSAASTRTRESNANWSFWRTFINPDETIIFCAATRKRRGFWSRFRQLILCGNDTTLEYRLIYVDPEQWEIKGEVPWTKEMPIKVIVVDDTHIDIVSPMDKHRTYHFLTLGKNTGALVWSQKINEVLYLQRGNAVLVSSRDATSITKRTKMIPVDY